MSARFHPLKAATCLLLLCGVVLAHDDDPKLRTKLKTRKGLGYRNALIANPSLGPGSFQLGGGGFPSSGMTLLSWLPMSAFGNPADGNDCWGYTSPSGREYAIYGHSNGTSFVEITNPGNPTVVAMIPTASGGSGNLWRDMKTYGHWCYIVTENAGGIQVVSMANIDSGVVTLVDTITGTGTNDTHNVAVNPDSGFLYRCGGSNEGLRIYTLSDPSKPTWVATWSTKYVHDAQIVSYTTGPYAGKEIAFCFDGFNGGWDQTGVDILDVTNKQNIQVLGSFQYPSPAYSHQGWLSPDKQYLYIGDELDEQDFGFGTRTHVYNVTNLAAPVNMGWFTNGSNAVGHNMYSIGDLLYQANYTSGLRVFDISNGAAPSEIAYFDTVPGSDSASFGGLWSCYPYFPSGVVIASDRDNGLFVLWPGDAQLAFSYPSGLPDYVDPAGESLPVTITESSPGQYEPGTAMLHVDSGSGFVSIPLNDLGGGSFAAQFPATDCGTHLVYYLTAEATSGIIWSDPPDAPLGFYEATAGLGEISVASDDMEVDLGWTVGAPGDDATTGTWIRVNPNGTSSQPEDDHTPTPGTMCWVTGQGSVGGGAGENDIDGGQTTLTSPVYDLSSLSAPVVSYWRWFDNTSSSSDVFIVDISNNGGASWTNLEVVQANSPESEGGWFQAQFLVSDYVALTSNVRLRFIAADEGTGTVIEAAIDDLEIGEVECSDCGTSNYCQTSPNSAGPGALMTSTNAPSVSQNNFTLVAYQGVPNQNGIFYYGPNQIQVPFGNGFRCVGGGVFRLNPATQFDGFGDITRQLDFTVPPASSGPGMISAGETWNFQFWYRDPAGGGASFNFSDGLSVTFCP